MTNRESTLASRFRLTNRKKLKIHDSFRLEVLTRYFEKDSRFVLFGAEVANVDGNLDETVDGGGRIMTRNAMAIVPTLTESE